MSDLWLNICFGKLHLQAKYGSLRPLFEWNRNVPERRWWEIHLFELKWPWPE